MIQSRIYNEGVITGSFTISEAQDLVLTLKSGALPAKVSILFESTVGPWLGKEPIRARAPAGAGFCQRPVRAAGVGRVVVVRWCDGARPRAPSRASCGHGAAASPIRRASA